MKALATSLLLAAATYIQAQATPAKADERLAAHIAEAVAQELFAAPDSAWLVNCRIVQYNEGTAGTGAALVMYAPARVHLTAEVALVHRATGNIAAMRTIHAQGRTDVEEASEDLVDRAALHMAEVLRSIPAEVPAMAREH